MNLNLQASHTRRFKELHVAHQEVLTQLQATTQRCQEAEKARDSLTEALAIVENEKVQLYRYTTPQHRDKEHKNLDSLVQLLRRVTQRKFKINSGPNPQMKFMLLVWMHSWFCSLVALNIGQNRRQKREIEAIQTKYKAINYEKRLATLVYEKSVMCKERKSVLQVRVARAIKMWSILKEVHWRLHLVMWSLLHYNICRCVTRSRRMRHFIVNLPRKQQPLCYSCKMNKNA